MLIFLLPVFSGGGAERVTLNILTGLHDSGYSVGIITFNKRGSLLSKVPYDIPIYDLGTITLKSSIIPLIKEIQKLKPRMVFSTLGYINVTLLLCRIFFPRSMKIWVREANLPSISLINNPLSLIMPTLYRLLYKRSDKLICTSFRMKMEFVSDFSVPREVIDILPNPVDVDMIRSSISSIERFDEGGVCYLASGRLTFQKGFDRLIYWFDKLTNKKSTLVILGEGLLKKELINIVKTLGIQNRIKFIGFCDNPWKWYAGADVFLLPSRWEGMPNSVLESLVCGTEVIATKESGGIKEVVEKGKGVIVVENDKEFIKAMSKVEIKNKNTAFESLLPEKYRKEKIIFNIKEWINEIN
jgi:glycosyltransferase involved in cell wall biosynthesis